MRVFPVALVALTVLLPCLAGVPEIDKGKALGSPTAPVKIEVFASFDCPHCRAFEEEVIPQLMKDYVVPGKVYLIHRSFPLSGPYHPYAREAADYATAAARIGRYDEVSSALFKNQENWAVNGKVWETVASVLTPTEQKKVQELAKSPGVEAEVQREYNEGIAAGVNATPTIIVTSGSKRYPIPSQELYYGFLKSLIDGMLK
jgi:protein-disulfide isomerase